MFEIPEDIEFSEVELLYAHIKTPQQSTGTYEFEYPVSHTGTDENQEVTYVCLDNSDKNWDAGDRYNGSKYQFVFSGDRPHFERRQDPSKPDIWFKSYQTGKDAPFVIERK